MNIITNPKGQPKGRDIAGIYSHFNLKPLEYEVCIKTFPLKHIKL
jgi:hypothetical protein